MAGLLVYSNNSLRLWHNTYTEIIIPVKMGAFPFVFLVLFFITIISFLKGLLLPISEPLKFYFKFYFLESRAKN